MKGELNMLFEDEVEVELEEFLQKFKERLGE